jgi:hypothetical protein
MKCNTSITLWPVWRYLLGSVASWSDLRTCLMRLEFACAFPFFSKCSRFHLALCVTHSAIKLSSRLMFKYRAECVFESLVYLIGVVSPARAATIVIRGGHACLSIRALHTCKLTKVLFATDCPRTFVSVRLSIHISFLRRSTLRQFVRYREIQW